MGRGVAVEPLQAQRDGEQAVDRLLLAARLLELRLAVDGLLQRDRVGGVVGHQLAEAVDLRIGHLQHAADVAQGGARLQRSEEHTSELQSLMRSSYAVFCLKTKKTK